MTESPSIASRITLGDPVPGSVRRCHRGRVRSSCQRRALGGAELLGSPSDPRAMTELAELLRSARSAQRGSPRRRMRASPSRPRPSEQLAADVSSNTLFFLADYDGAISRDFGALGDAAHGRARSDAAGDRRYRLGRSAGPCRDGPRRAARPSRRSTTPPGVPMFAPALIVPRVFSFELCDFLIQFYEAAGRRRFRLSVRRRRQDHDGCPTGD